jgi:peptidyl-tRNA hydrolase
MYKCNYTNTDVLEVGRHTKDEHPEEYASDSQKANTAIKAAKLRAMDQARQLAKDSGVNDGKITEATKKQIDQQFTYVRVGPNTELPNSWSKIRDKVEFLDAETGKALRELYYKNTKWTAISREDPSASENENQDENKDEDDNENEDENQPSVRLFIPPEHDEANKAQGSPEVSN